MILSDVGTLFKNIGRFYKNSLVGNYHWGHSIDRLTENSWLGGLLDVAIVGAAGYLAALPLLSTVVGIAVAVVGVATAAVTIPAALGTIGLGILFGAMEGWGVAIGLGALADLKDKVFHSGSGGYSYNAGRAINQTVQASSNPLKWAKRQLSHAFKSTHDRSSPARSPSLEDFKPAKSLHFKL